MLEARAPTSKAQEGGLYLLLFYRIDIGHSQGKIEVNIIWKLMFSRQKQIQPLVHICLAGTMDVFRDYPPLTFD